MGVEYHTFGLESEGRTPGSISPAQELGYRDGAKTSLREPVQDLRQRLDRAVLVNVHEDDCPIQLNRRLQHPVENELLALRLAHGVKHVTCPVYRCISMGGGGLLDSRVAVAIRRLPVLWPHL